VVNLHQNDQIKKKASILVSFLCFNNFLQSFIDKCFLISEGADLDSTHPDVVAQKAMHGQNLFPRYPENFKGVVTTYLDRLTELGHVLMEAIGISLSLPRDFFRDRFTRSPFTIFRIFHYPRDLVGVHEDNVERWGVGEHTDYGVLTILAQDNTGGLEVKTRDGNWLPVPPIENSFVVNIGDMLQLWTAGKYRAAPHRVKNRSEHNRLSVPFFFDPNFDCLIEPIDGSTAKIEVGGRLFECPFRYGDYIHQKIVNCFPKLQPRPQQNLQ